MNNTVLILGAGASVDYGFPTGAGLTKYIRSTGEWEPWKESLLGSWSELGLGSELSYIHGFNTIKDRFSPARIKSIDSWIAKEANQECVEAAKLLIARFISIRENRLFTSNEFFKNQEHPEKTQKPKPDWYEELFNVLATPEKLKDFPASQDKLTIVTFNYDRSLEYYFLKALQGTYGQPAIDCWNQLDKLNITHVYGNVGDLPIANEIEGVEYGSTLIQDYPNRIKNLELIPESRNTNDETISLIRGKLKEARNIFFVGFSYDEANLKLLDFPICSEKPTQTKIYGSVYRMEHGEIKKAQKTVWIKGSTKPFKHVDADAYTFFMQIITSCF